MRSLKKSAFLAPLALVGSVVVVGLFVFGPTSAQAASNTSVTASTRPAPTTTSPNLFTSGSTSTTRPSGYTVPTPRSTTSTTIPGVTTLGGSQPYVAPTGTPGLAYLNLPAAFLKPGQALFAANCATCHGNQAEGSSRAPNLQGLGSGTVDFWVSTGRMPLENDAVQATRKPPKFNQLQTLQMAAWVQSLTPGVGTQIPVVNTSKANLSNGQQYFTLNCAACHTITGAGDALANGAYAPTLHLAKPYQVVEAIRSGPGNMPRFGSGNITNAQARDIAAYVVGVLQHPANPGGYALGGVGPVGEGFVGLLFGVGTLMLICFWIGDRT